MDRYGIIYYKVLIIIFLTFNLILLYFLQCNIPVFSYTGYQDKSYFYQNLNNSIKNCVSDDGMINFTELKKDQKHLELFMFAIKGFDPQDYKQLPADSKFAFWINTYNAIVLKTILDYYPVNSIKEIRSFYKKKRYKVMGELLSLDQIEHEVIRKKFKDPRINTALYKGTVGSALLRNEAYLGNILDEQLSNQTQRFLKNPTKFQIDHYNSIIYISPIFKWHAKDFMQSYYTSHKYKAAKPEMRAVMNFIESYSTKNVVAFFYTKIFDIEYLDYSWKLNDIMPPTTPEK